MKKLLELSIVAKVGLVILLVIILVSLFFGDIRAWLGIPIYFLLIFIILYFDEPECWEDLKPKKTIAAANNENLLDSKIENETTHFIELPEHNFTTQIPKKDNKESKEFVKNLMKKLEKKNLN